MSAIRERPVHRYSEVFGFGAKGQVSSLKLSFSPRLASLLLIWKTADTVSIVLRFNVQVSKYLPVVAMFLLNTASTACQTPSACMIA